MPSMEKRNFESPDEVRPAGSGEGRIVKLGDVTWGRGFAQPDPVAAHEQWRKVADSFRPRFPRLATLLDEAEADVLAYLAFPAEHWRQLWSTNPLERLNRRSNDGRTSWASSQTPARHVRLVGAVLAEQHHEWQASRRYFSVESLAKLERKEADALPLLAAS
jgi:putative transposase